MIKSNMYLCDNCGAEIFFKPRERVKECTYCGNISALVDEDVEKLGFNKIIPFEMTQEQILLLLSKYEKINIENMNIEKVYIPYYVLNFDLVYFAHIEETRTTSRGGNKIVFSDVFIEGNVKEFKACAFDNNYNILYDKYIKLDKILDYDPILLENSQIIKDKFIYYERIIDFAAKEYGKSIVKSRDARIISEDSAESNENIEIVLVPFYRVSSDNLKDTYVLGQNVEEKIKLSKRLPFLHLSFIILSIGIVFSFVCGKLFFTLVFIIILAILFIYYCMRFDKSIFKEKNYKMKKI